MKKLIFSMAVLFLGIISPKQIKAQDPMCATLKTQFDAAEKLSAQISARKTATDDFINSVYEPVNDAIIDDEIEFTNAAISKVNGKIIAGDNSTDTKNELQLLRNRLDMLKLKKQGKLSLADPRLDEQTNAFKALLRAEEQQQEKVASIEREMKKRNCPMAKSDGGDITITKELDDKPPPVTSAGTWKYATKDGVINLKLDGSGSSTTGKMTFSYAGQAVPDYIISNCRENGQNKLVCNFNNKVEDYEKYVETNGTVSLEISTANIKTTWQEVGSPKVTWKPGAKTREYIPRPPKSYNITFTK